MKVSTRATVYLTMEEAGALRSICADFLSHLTKEDEDELAQRECERSDIELVKTLATELDEALEPFANRTWHNV